MDSREQKVAAAQARMAELAAKFVGRSAGELASMREHFAKLESGDAGAVADIRYLAHRMCGTGATLGFLTLSDCATRLEKLADAQVAGSGPDVGALLQFGVALEALGVEIERLQRDFA
jgi:chemotaxis protein histidine kinase CheA